VERDDERRAGERNRRESGIGGGVYGERGDFDGGEYGVGEQRDGGRGWKTANTLQVGDTFLTSDDRRVVLERIEDHNRYVAVYNLEVEADHTYFVGGSGWGFDVWSHNHDTTVDGAGNIIPVNAHGVPSSSFTPKPGIAPYVRPAAGPTAAQKASVQGKACVVCNETKPKMVADHKDPLAVEHYRTGTNNIANQKSIGAVQPHCPQCSSSQGGQMSNFSTTTKKKL